MERVIEEVAALIEHLRLESLEEQTTCFYCGRSHRTVDCRSAKRESFLLSLAQWAATAEEEEEAFSPEKSEDMPQEDICFSFDEVIVSLESEPEMYE